MKTEWLVANVHNSCRIPCLCRAERDILLGVILDIFRPVQPDVFWLIQAASVVGEPLCDVEIFS